MSDETETVDLTEQLQRVEEQLTELHAEVRRLGLASTLATDPVDPPPTPAAYAWLGALEAPVRRRPQVPRLLLEGLFLAAAAAAAAIADLDPVAIGGVMVGAWILVALIEWAASRADRRQELPLYAPAPAAPPGRRPGVVRTTGRADLPRRRGRRFGDGGDPPPASGGRGRGDRGAAADRLSRTIGRERIRRGCDRDSGRL